MNLHTILRYTSGFSPLKPSDKAALAAEIMSMYTVRCYPVSFEDKFLGYVWNSDLEDVDSDSPIKSLVKREAGKTLRGDEGIYDIVESLVGNNMDCMAVVNPETGIWQGTVRAWDVLAVFSDSATFRQDGAYLVIEMSALQYSLSHLTQICEGEDMQVIGVLIDRLDKESNLIHVHLKVNGHKLDRLINAMKRYDFDVPFYSQSREEPGVIKERYDSLMKFLDI